MLRRWLPAVGLAALGWSALGAATANYRGVLTPFAFGPRHPFVSFLLGSLVLAAHFVVHGWRQLNDDTAWVVQRLRPLTPWIVGAASVLAFAFGVRYGTYAATGSDSYGYISQAGLWQRGNLRVAQPLAAQMPWPDVDISFSPLAYRPATNGHAIVSTVAPGLPLVMAVVTRVAGECAAYYVGPVFGACGVCLCFVMGARAESRAAGAVAAILLAASPIFLSQVIFPWTDVPAAA